MKHLNMDRKSIAFRLTTLTIVIIIGQAALLTFFLIIGGVISQAEQNSYNSFSEKVRNRKDYLQREMKYRWMNMDPYVEQISERYDKESNSDQFFLEISDPLISMLRATQVTGVFVILNQKGDAQDEAKEALYIRDYDPVLNDYNNRDLYYIFGPSGLANRLQIPLDRMWKHRMDMSALPSEFYEMPLSKAPLTSTANLLGYWSLPFHLSPDDGSIITYTRPLFDDENRLIGIVGVEVSEQYLSKFLPATDLQMKDSYGYMLGYRQAQEDNIEPIMLTRAIQKRIAQNGQPLEYKARDLENSIYILENHNLKGNIYLSIESLGLYNNNTPFQQSQWYLIGIMGENHLLSYVTTIQSILVVSMLASVFIGVVFAYFFSYRFTKPIILVSRKTKETNTGKRIELEKTGLKEVDELLKIIQSTSNMLLETSGRMSKIIEMVGLPLGVFEYSDNEKSVFFTDQLPLLLSLSSAETEVITADKERFTRIIDQLLSNPEEEEEDIYSVSCDPERWLKIKLARKDATTLGVIMDATDEMTEKKRIMTERDIDPLTGILNRKALHLQMEDGLLKRNENLAAAILMFDLDNLKSVNDTYGHSWGDLYIKQAVKHLEMITAEGKVLGRRSGDEFALLLYDRESKEDIRHSIETFYMGLKSDSMTYPDQSKGIAAVSAGLVWVGPIETTLDEYLNKADELMYEAKRNEKGYYCEGTI
ncbi:diguanylate cyclase [Anoxybacterium hadale]|uniref:Diguanylate cyclase n=1 Tax=Anoxybacterium hadale TaxID=3408580 RepID=A0ACD1A8D3_9FIRM|nr:diguanylate cyclase [Clostridiales bacterium]